MNPEPDWSRSNRLLEPHRSGLLVVDMQERLLPLIQNAASVRWNVQRLIRAAALLEVELAVTEQYPERLGATVSELGPLAEKPTAKRAFSAAACQSVRQRFEQRGLRQLIVCGIETHVCVLQTALDWLAAGYDVFVVADAVGARGELDHHIALQRMRDQGVNLLSTEGSLFEWTKTSTHPQFKAISALVKSQPPSNSS